MTRKKAPSARKPRDPAAKRKPVTPTSGKATTAASPKLLSGGNPQIPKGYGDEPVRAYIAAMPGWKRDVGLRIDQLIQKAVPNVNRAVKWNSPLYGVREGEWFMSMHCFAKYVKVAFFNGAELEPMPPEPSKQKRVRYLHVHEDDSIDERQFVKWAQQASTLPGERM